MATTKNNILTRRVDLVTKLKATGINLGLYMVTLGIWAIVDLFRMGKTGQSTGSSIMKFGYYDIGESGSLKKSNNLKGILIYSLLIKPLWWVIVLGTLFTILLPNKAYLSKKGYSLPEKIAKLALLKKSIKK